MNMLNFNPNYSLPTRKHIFLSIVIFTLAVAITKITLYCFFQEGPRVGAPGSISLVVDTKSSGFQQSAATRLDAMAKLNNPITLKLEEANSVAIAAELSRQCGKEITIKPGEKEDITITVDIKNVAMRDVLRFLSDNYTETVIQIAGYEFRALDRERAELFAFREVIFSISVSEVPLREVVQIVQSLSSHTIRFDEGDGSKKVTLNLENTNVRDVIEKLSAQTGSKLVIEN